MKTPFLGLRGDNMKGFTIKCNDCGKETMITDDLVTDNNNIDIRSTGYDEQVGMFCECGNKAEDLYG